ncbi:MAG: family 20 glycosylhydrolase [Chryseolinea sp.]
MKSITPLLLTVLILAACAPEKDQFDPAKVGIEWSLVRNITDEKPTFRASLTLSNNGDAAMRPSGWKLYFNLRYHGYQLTSQSTEIDIRHVSGDLFYLVPTVNFAGLKPGQSISVDYTGDRRIANFQDVPAGFFWVSNTDTTSSIKLYAPVIATERSMAKLPEPDGSVIFSKNKAIIDIPEVRLSRIFPTGIRETNNNEIFNLSSKAEITTDASFLGEADYLSEELSKVINGKVKVLRKSSPDAAIEIRRAGLPPENYHLTINRKKILIEAGDAAGAFYGIQSLKILLPSRSWKTKQDSIIITGLDVVDGPRFPFREFMLDVSRNFQSKEEVLKTLEIMSLYKLNVFHFHLTDDEGWRIEIPGIPELTANGATRGYPFADRKQLHPSYGSGPTHQDSGTGYYSVDDYIEIVRYAKTRHIKVVPEIESPGHARAAIIAMQVRYEKHMEQGDQDGANRYTLSDPEDKSIYISNQYFNDNVMNVALPSTYTFIEKVIDELMIMHQKAGAPLSAIHMAGDEVPFGSWGKSPAVAEFRKGHPNIVTGNDLWKYYFAEISRILRSKKLTMYGWQELVVGTQTKDDGKHMILPELVSNDLQVDAWWNMQGNEDVPYQLPNAGYKTVLTCFDFLYFDLAYEPSFQEPGDAWIGFLDIDRIFSFVPYDYYRTYKTDVRGNPVPKNLFDGKARLAENSKVNVMGIQGALWGENMVSGDLMEYMLVPRLLALAERAWAKDPSWATEQNEVKAQQQYNRDWSRFANILGKRELPRLDFYSGKIRYRIPTPGAIVENGNVMANIQLPGFQIRYTSDGSEPNEASTLYKSPVTEKGVIRMRAFDLRGRGSLPLTVINK